MLANLYKNNVFILILRNITGILPKISLIFENYLKNIAVTLLNTVYNILIKYWKRYKKGGNITITEILH